MFIACVSLNYRKNGNGPYEDISHYIVKLGEENWFFVFSAYSFETSNTLDKKVTMIRIVLTNIQ